MFGISPKKDSFLESINNERVILEEYYQAMKTTNNFNQTIKSLDINHAPALKLLDGDLQCTKSKLLIEFFHLQKKKKSLMTKLSEVNSFKYFQLNDKF